MKLDEPIAFITKANFEKWALGALSVKGGELLLRDLAGFMEPEDQKTVTWTTVPQMVQDYRNQFPEKEEAYEVELEKPTVQGKKRGRKPKTYIPEPIRAEAGEIISDIEDIEVEEIDLNKPLFVRS